MPVIKVESKEIKIKSDYGTLKMYPAIENLTVEPSSIEQVFNHPNSYGYDTVTVKAIEADNLNITPTTQNQEYTGLYGTVNVSAVDSSIDSNIQAENIKKGVSILGVTGEMKDANVFFCKIMAGTIDEDIEVTLPDGVESVVTGLYTNNYNLIIKGNLGIKNKKIYNAGAGEISLPDTTGEYCINYFLSGCIAKKVYCPELVRINGSVLFNGSYFDYLYLPKLTTIPGNFDFVTTVTNKSLYFPSVTQIGTGKFKQAFGAPIKYVILGTTNCVLGHSDNIKVINTSGGNIFVPSGSVNDYKTATNWSVYPNIIVGYTDVNVHVGDTITLTGGNSYNLTTLWYWNTENCATLSGNTLTLIDTGDVLIKKFDSNNACIGGEIYHISEV